jgi:hypothetical protein
MSGTGGLMMKKLKCKCGGYAVDGLDVVGGKEDTE